MCIKKGLLIIFDFKTEIEKYGLTLEQYDDCLKDIFDKVENNSDLDWSDIIENYTLPISKDTLRKASSPLLFGSVFVNEYLKNRSFKSVDDNVKSDSEIDVKIRELKKERYKLQTEKLENNRWLRENARDELIVEKIIQAIHDLPPMEIPEVLPVIHSNKEFNLAFGDEHYNTEFEIRGLYNEILNAYSPEIFESRMWDLFNQVIEIIHKEQITKLNVFSMGDFTDGLLRVSQLMKLRYGTIEGTIKYADFICNWLNKLTNYVNIEYQMVFGNHSELRMLGQPKGTFKDDNTGLYVREIIKERLKDNPNFHMTINPTGLIFTEVCGLKLLGIHGEVKNLENALKDFSNTYNTQIDILIGGHLHHGRSECVGVNRDIISVPSIIGIDDYSLSLNKTSNAGATLFIVEEGKGKVQEYNIKLN